MDPVSAVPVLGLFGLAFASAGLLTKIFGAPPAQGRFASIDGLRGYLAFGVFLHHACVWYFYLRSGDWKLPPSDLYVHLGKGGVSFFFMITGFLFYLKLMDGKKRPIDWLRLYVSRVLRLTPLYALAMICLFTVVFILSDATLNVPVPSLLSQLLRWLLFTITGARDINGIQDTWIIVAGVTWSLRYEWLFYLCLPLMALTVGLRPPGIYLAMAVVVSAGAALLWMPPILLLLPFVGGIAAALLSRQAWFCQFAIRPVASVVIVSCVALCIGLFKSPEGLIQILLLSIAFALIACGNTLFGALTHAFSRTLGELAYSLYLLHGLLLFTVFKFAIGFEHARSFSALEHWGLIAVLTPVLIFLCFATYKLIEEPSMLKVGPATAWLRRRLPVTRRVDGSNKAR